MTEMVEGSNPLEGLTYEEIKAFVDFTWPWPLSAVQAWFENFYNQVQVWTYERARQAVDFVLRYASPIWETMKAHMIAAVTYWFEKATWYWTRLKGWVDNAIESFFATARTYWDAVSTRVSLVMEHFFDTARWFWEKVQAATEWIAVKFTELRSWVSTKWDEFWEKWEPRMAYWTGQILGIWDKMTPWLSLKFQETQDATAQQLQAGYQWSTGKFDEVKGFITENITDPLRDFFAGWIQAIKDAMRAALDAAWGMFWSAWEKMITFFNREILGRVIGAFKWLADLFMDAINAFWDAIKGWVEHHSPITPEQAVPSAFGIMGIMGLSAIGLSAMVIGGEAMHPLKEMGLGHIAAMIGDVVNFRTISGAIMGAFIGTAIRTPLTYYVNRWLRPVLPDRREIMEMRGHQLIDREVFTKVLGYHGIGDQWHDLYEEMAFSGLGYFGLRAIADSGYFDKGLFERDLKHRRYPQETIDALLVMFESMSTGEAKAMFSSYAITGFKEGHFDETTLRDILAMLGYKQPGLDRIVFAAWLAYEIDYRSDLLSGYREAFRKDQITEDEYRSSLRELPIVPERVDSYLFLDTVKKIGKIPVPKLPPAYYETAEGKLRVTTARRLWRAGVIGDRELVSSLVDYEMPSSMADAVLEEEKAMKLPTRVPAPPPLRYETDTGKVELDTVKDQYYKELIDRPTALAQMLGLEVPRELAEAMLENIETRRIKPV